jgi:hypothetical protein
MLLVMVVIGIMATMTIPRLTRRKPTAEWKVVTEEINNLLYYARQEAIANKKIYRLNFNSVATAVDKVEVEVEEDDPKKPDKKIYKSVKSYYFNPIYKFPEEISIEAIYHGKEEQLEIHNNHGFCHVIPNGLVQEIYVHLKREEEKGGIVKRTLKVSPFLGRFDLLEGFIRP